MLQVTAARSSLERQLNLSQAEARSLASRLKETSQALALLQVGFHVYHIHACLLAAAPVPMCTLGITKSCLIFG